MSSPSRKSLPHTLLSEAEQGPSVKERIAIHSRPFVASTQPRGTRPVTTDEMPIVHINGLPYVAPDWLHRRIVEDQVREQRWLARASQYEHRRDDSGVALRVAYLSHALDAAYRANRRRRELEEVLRAGGGHVE